jgi:hypothetical protein
MTYSSPVHLFWVGQADRWGVLLFLAAEFQRVKLYYAVVHQMEAQGLSKEMLLHIGPHRPMSTWTAPEFRCLAGSCPTPSIMSPL